MRFVSQCDISFYVFDDDDRIVHHNPNRQHQPKQRQRIKRKAQRQHDRKRSNQRHRKRQQWNDGGAPRLQEDQHHNHDQDQRFDKRVTHSLNRFAHENRWVVDDFVVHTLRK